jgi:hypothetical protein
MTTLLLAAVLGQLPDGVDVVVAWQSVPRQVVVLRGGDGVEVGVQVAPRAAMPYYYQPAPAIRAEPPRYYEQPVEATRYRTRVVPSVRIDAPHVQVQVQPSLSIYRYRAPAAACKQ